MTGDARRKYGIKCAPEEEIFESINQVLVNAIERRQWSIILLDFSLTVKAATLIFISGCGSTISSAKEGKSGFIHNLVKS